MIYDLHLEIMIVIYIVLIIPLCIKRFKKRINNRRFLVLCILNLYVLILVKSVIFHFTFEHFPWAEHQSYWNIQIFPFSTIYTLIKHHNYIQIIGNVLLLIPVPFFYYELAESSPSPKKLVLFSSVCSLLIESSQLIINLITKIDNHVVDVDDVILNIAGCFLIVLLFKPLIKVYEAVISKIID